MSSDGQPPDVFKNKKGSFKLNYKTHKMVDQRISRIVQSALTNHAEALTGRAAKYYVYGMIADTGVAAEVLPVNVSDTSANSRAAREIKLVGCAMDGVIFHGSGHIESGLFEAETHPASTGEQIDTYRPSSVCAHSKNFIANIVA